MTAQELRAWLVSKISEITGLKPHEIGLQEPFDAYGLVSKDAIMLSGELENLLCRRLSPTLLYDHPSVGALVQHLTAQSDDSEPGRQPGPSPTQKADPLDDILASLEPLSEAEAEALLEEATLS